MSARPEIPRLTGPTRPARIAIGRRLILALLILGLTACGQKGPLYREKKPESRLGTDAGFLVP